MLIYRSTSHQDSMLLILKPRTILNLISLHCKIIQLRYFDNNNKIYFKLNFYVVITNPNEESYEYIHYAQRDLRNLSAVLYGGDHVLKKVTLLKDIYDSE